MRIAGGRRGGRGQAEGLHFALFRFTMNHFQQRFADVMTTHKKAGDSSRILDAIRAKREHRTSQAGELEQLEASLLADIDSFDLNEAERQARREQLASMQGGMSNLSMVFPEIVPAGAVRHLDLRTRDGDTREDPEWIARSSDFLGQLRQRAELRQRELHVEMAVRSASNDVLEHALKTLFFFLHDVVQQLNIVKPAIQREYVAAGDVMFSGLVWQEGFADYRTQSQSRGAMVELVTLAYQLESPLRFSIKREGPGVERLRMVLFDYGLQFTCKEFKNERSYVERAEFEIGGRVGVSARWKADFANGVLILESRNLERLGSVAHTLRPGAIDQELLDEFGRLLLGMPNHFRELAKR